MPGCHLQTKHLTNSLIEKQKLSLSHFCKQPFYSYSTNRIKIIFIYTGGKGLLGCPSLRSDCDVGSSRTLVHMIRQTETF